MRVLVVGGTLFIGRRIVEELIATGHEPVVVHRGTTEPADLPDCRHLHVARADFGSVAATVARLRPDAVVDTRAMSASDVTAVLPHLPEVPTVVLSSADVYQAYDVFRFGGAEQPVPITETAPVRSRRFPYRTAESPEHDYEKLDVEGPYLDHGAAVLRLGFVYGEHDPQRREEFVLRRVRAGRDRIPFGDGSLLLSRVHVGDVAVAVRRTLETPEAGGQVFSIVEDGSVSVRGWAEQILAAAGHVAELVSVPPEALPADLDLTGRFGQHLLFSNVKARTVLNWQPADPAVTIPDSVRWHLDHPPAGDDDWSADDAALAVGPSRTTTT